MYRHAWAAASDGAKAVKIFQISIKRVEKTHPVYTSILNHSVLNGRVCWLYGIGSVSPPSPCTCQSSTHLPFARCTEAGVNYIACLQLRSTRILPESPLGISECILNRATYVTVFGLMPHLISICGHVSDRMPSGRHWNNSGTRINHEWSMHTEANNVLSRGQHILSFAPFMSPVNVTLWAVLRVYQSSFRSLKPAGGQTPTPALTFELLLTRDSHQS